MTIIIFLVENLKKEDVYYRLSEITQLHNSILKQKKEKETLNH